MNLGADPSDTPGIALTLALFGPILPFAKGMSGMRKGGPLLDRTDGDYEAMREQSRRLAAARAEQDARMDEYLESRKDDSKATELDLTRSS